MCKYIWDALNHCYDIAFDDDNDEKKVASSVITILMGLSVSYNLMIIQLTDTCVFNLKLI